MDPNILGSSLVGPQKREPNFGKSPYVPELGFCIARYMSMTWTLNQRSGGELGVGSSKG